MKIHRAHWKTVEEMPDWVKCCDARIVELRELYEEGEFKVVIGSEYTSHFGDFYCAHCGQNRPSALRIKSTENNTVFIDMIWIDEGVEEQSTAQASPVSDVQPSPRS